MRQRGTQFWPGQNGGMGGDNTLFAKIDGQVKFESYGGRARRISVYAKA